MALDPAARAELERHMEERRTHLGLRWSDVADTMKMTVEGIRGIRKGPSSIPAFTRRALERALKWPTGEVDRILGDEPPMPSQVSAPKEWSAEQRAQWRRMSIDEIIERGAEIGEAIEGPAGVQARLRYLRAALQEKEDQLSVEDVPQ